MVRQKDLKLVFWYNRNVTTRSRIGNQCKIRTGAIVTVSGPPTKAADTRGLAETNNDTDISQSDVRRLTGAYYTPPTAADFMADWLVRRDGEHILEPSFGEGIFLHSVGASAARRGFGHVRITGIEIDSEALRRERKQPQLINEDLRYGDFLAEKPFTVQAVIGNPPYVRLRHLPADQRQSAVNAARVAMGYPMEPSGSVWMPFVLHAMRFLDQGGRLALVLPHELTYVRYARPLWNVLRSHFGSVRVIRTHERLFPEILQDVILLLAEDYGARTDTVQYHAFERVSDLLAGRPVVDQMIDVDDLLRGERRFVEALLDADLRHMLRARIADATVQARDVVTFNIGYVSGDRVFFHPGREAIQKYDLPLDALHPALTSTRALRGRGLRTAAIDVGQADHLFLPEGRPLTVGERDYVKWGERTGVSDRYKCQIRDPWYVVPGVRTPDVILSVFSERPVLLVNDGRYIASNSLLCGFSQGVEPVDLAARWYTSLTLLQCEVEIHALGGGVMVAIPGEVGNVRLPRMAVGREAHIERLDCCLRRGDPASAYRAGDREILTDQMGLCEDDVSLIRHGIEVLAHWRTSARSSLASEAAEEVA
jgi:hypothetical protein